MYDVLVIGSGPGGYAAAIRTSQLGGKAAIVEAREVGGTCVNRGCVPSKIWLRAAYVLKLINQSKEFGIQASINKVDFKSIIDRKNGVANDIRTGMEALLEANGVDLIRAHGVIKNAHEAAVDGKTVGAKKIILATGSHLDIPNIEGIKNALLTTDQVFDMTEVPKSVLIWGEAGSIDVEIASLLNMLGSTVYLATQHARILTSEDHDTIQRLSQAFREQGIKIITRTKLESVKKSQKKFKAILMGKEKETLNIERVVISNRKPNIDGIGIKQAGIRVNEDGSLWTNENLQTSLAGVYAIGDVTGGWMNSHSASAMAVTAAENAMGQTKEFLFKLIPRGLWTFPQVGSIGLSEEDAEKEGFEVEVGNFPYAINGLAMGYGDVDGAVKIVMEAKTEEILGIHIVGANATELVGEAVMALQLECTADELAHTIRVHPTFSETLMDAGRDASGWALYLPPNR
jgi:dihydrolipoamide dehydrogenase